MSVRRWSRNGLRKRSSTVVTNVLPVHDAIAQRGHDLLAHQRLQPVGGRRGPSIASRTNVNRPPRVRATRAVWAPLRIRILRRANGRHVAGPLHAGCLEERRVLGDLHDPGRERLRPRRPALPSAPGSPGGGAVTMRSTSVTAQALASRTVATIAGASAVDASSSATRRRSRSPFRSTSSQGRITTPGSPARARAASTVARRRGKRPWRVALLGRVRDDGSSGRVRGRPRRRRQSVPTRPRSGR